MLKYLEKLSFPALFWCLENLKWNFPHFITFEVFQFEVSHTFFTFREFKVEISRTFLTVGDFKISRIFYVSRISFGFSCIFLYSKIVIWIFPHFFDINRISIWRKRKKCGKLKSNYIIISYIICALNSFCSVFLIVLSREFEYLNLLLGLEQLSISVRPASQACEWILNDRWTWIVSLWWWCTDESTKKWTISSMK